MKRVVKSQFELYIRLFPEILAGEYGPAGVSCRCVPDVDLVHDAVRIGQRSDIAPILASLLLTNDPSREVSMNPLTIGGAGLLGAIAAPIAVVIAIPLLLARPITWRLCVPVRLHTARMPGRDRRSRGRGVYR